MLDSGYTANLKFRWAFQSAFQSLRNFSKFHGEGSSILCGAVCESRTGQRGKYSEPSEGSPRSKMGRIPPTNSSRGRLKRPNVDGVWHSLPSLLFCKELKGLSLGGGGRQKN
jgi:hypothetical protein